ncbi:hypothetical protein [Campylobacter sp.]|uniref:hypothetical protein n=1 Tax=Campylobacter sp. TaxID=205 RepID=UPI002A821273|nr:hypothetical protein [Campylobacter sp.]MDY4803292.1 hypothetical protein [Campylobacter sp.]
MINWSCFQSHLILRSVGITIWQNQMTIYQNDNHQIQGKNVDYAKKMIDFLLRKSYCESFGGYIFSTLELSVEINPNLKEKAINAIIKALDEIDPENIVFVKN